MAQRQCSTRGVPSPDGITAPVEPNYGRNEYDKGPDLRDAKQQDDSGQEPGKWDSGDEQTKSHQNSLHECGDDHAERNRTDGLTGKLHHALATLAGEATAEANQAVSCRFTLRVHNGRNDYCQQELDNDIAGGIYDPQSYIANLIAMFEEIGSNVKPDLLRLMKCFKLTSPNRLAGQQGSGQ